MTQRRDGILKEMHEMKDPTSENTTEWYDTMFDAAVDKVIESAA